MTNLYTPAESARLKRFAKYGAIAAASTLLLGLAACVVLCARVTTMNALTLQWTTIALATLTGWAAILLLGLLVIPSRVTAKHVDWMLTGDREETCGALSLSPERIQIPHSIAIRKLRVTDGDTETVLNLYDRKAALLPLDGRRVRVVTVRRYVVAWEVCDENA